MSLEDRFIRFLEQYKGLILKVAGVYCPSVDRNDLVQDIIMQLWKSFPNYNEKLASMSTWTYRIALNVSISFLRKESTRLKTQEGLQEHLDLIQCEDPVFNERLSFLHQQLNHLKPMEKAILILHLDGNKNKEIAEIIGVSASHVSTIIHRIKKSLIEKAKLLNEK